MTRAHLSEEKYKTLMVAGMAGDAHAYHALLLLCAARLRSYFRRRLPGRGDDVEDLVQETLMAVHAKRASYLPSLPFTAWLHGIARYRLIDHYRREERRAALPLDETTDLGTETDEEVLLAELEIERLLAQLTPKQDAAIRLTRLGGYSVREAAEISGQSEPAIKVNVHRGLVRLIARIHGKDQDADR